MMIIQKIDESSYECLYCTPMNSTAVYDNDEFNHAISMFVLVVIAIFVMAGLFLCMSVIFTLRLSAKTRPTVDDYVEEVGNKP